VSEEREKSACLEKKIEEPLFALSHFRPSTKKHRRLKLSSSFFFPSPLSSNLGESSLFSSPHSTRDHILVCYALRREETSGRSTGSAST
jgi:hypothetical protein